MKYNKNTQTGTPLFPRAAISLAVLLLATLACNVVTTKAGALQTDSQTVEAAAADAVRANVIMGAGSVVIDLRGAWESDMDATIGGGLGDLTLKLPRDVGVRVQANAGLGEVRANGFRIQDDAYVNDAFGQSNITLEINIDTGVGTVTLELGE